MEASQIHWDTSETLQTICTLAKTIRFKLPQFSQSVRQCVHESIKAVGISYDGDILHAMTISNTCVATRTYAIYDNSSSRDTNRKFGAFLKMLLSYGKISQVID